MNSTHLNHLYRLAIVAAVVVFMSGCATSAKMPGSGIELDSARHHYTLGTALLEAGKFPAAREEFARTLELHPNHVLAMAGMATCHIRTGAFDEATEILGLARRKASPGDERLAVNLAEMELLAASRPDSALRTARKLHESVRIIGRQTDAADYYLAEVLVIEGRYAEAERLFATCSAAQGPWSEKAAKRWSFLQERARHVGMDAAAKEIIDSPAVTRAQFCALLSETFELHQYISQLQKAQQPRAEFEPPNAATAQRSHTIPEDVDQHPLRNDIILAMAMGLRGMSVADGALFHPDEQLSRGELALVMEDIALLGGRNADAASFIGNTSPFADMQPSHFAYNAATYCTHNAIMAPQSDGRFAPDAPVDGLTALRALDTLRHLPGPAGTATQADAASGDSDLALRLAMALIRSSLMVLL